MGKAKSRSRNTNQIQHVLHATLHWCCKRQTRGGAGRTTVSVGDFCVTEPRNKHAELREGGLTMGLTPNPRYRWAQGRWESRNRMQGHKDNCDPWSEGNGLEGTEHREMKDKIEPRWRSGSGEVPRGVRARIATERGIYNAEEWLCKAGGPAGGPDAKGSERGGGRKRKEGNDRIDEVSTDSPIWTGRMRLCTDHQWRQARARGRPTCSGVVRWKMD
ncbi:hypothetical protein DFH08DRAFT_993443 [Mycena albidolilacea]|uniref:Uncharacterized protein n=1 Tax=Mycena albidolilacea TaxID=1033008 RepID=A0AAD6YYA1_9AGAR|nr:hypothetical protein DFH08DRAFT_993443 [Mycena albidolilacea]